MNKILSILMAASIGLCVAPAVAQSSGTAAKQPAKKTAPARKKAVPKKAAPKIQGPDVSGFTVIEYKCADGDKLTIYRNPANEQEVALGWNKQIHSMTRVETESGAERLENNAQGLLWIGIPAKAMLLDSKKGQKLANGCMKPGQ